MSETETYVGYVTGWRWWLLDDKSKQPSPCSIGLPYRWSWSGENSTEELQLSNQRGFYAYKSACVERIGMTGSLLFGRVALYGIVVVHMHGYRAEKARILDAWCAPEMWRRLAPVKQVKGTFELKIAGDTEWLTLVNLTEQSDIIPSDSPTIPLRTRSRRP